MDFVEVVHFRLGAPIFVLLVAANHWPPTDIEFTGLDT